MKKFLFVFIIFTCNQVYATNMFDDSGNYSGNWKPMTNIKSVSNRYDASSYSSSSWYTNNRKQKIYQAENQSSLQSNAVPFRYNTLNYTRVRKVKGGYGDYSVKCSDIGDASFCQ